MILRIDHHFHPNIPKNPIKSKKKLRKIWEKVRATKLNVIIVTEHAYKNPQKAYELMVKSKPKDLDVMIIPGIEFVSKKGIDSIAFYKDDSIYDIGWLTESFQLEIEEIIDRLNKLNIPNFIAHPFGYGASVISNYVDENEIKRLSKKSGGYEVYNFTSLNMWCKSLENPLFRMLLKILPNKINPFYKIKKTNEIFEEIKKEIRFTSIGSDAHVPRDLKNYKIIECDKKFNISNVIKAITNNKRDDVSFTSDFGKNRIFHSVCRTLVTVSFEGFTKKKLRGENAKRNN